MLSGHDKSVILEIMIIVDILEIFLLTSILVAMWCNSGPWWTGYGPFGPFHIIVHLPLSPVTKPARGQYKYQDLRTTKYYQIFYVLNSTFVLYTYFLSNKGSPHHHGHNIPDAMTDTWVRTESDLTTVPTAQLQSQGHSNSN